MERSEIFLKSFQDFHMKNSRRFSGKNNQRLKYKWNGMEKERKKEINWIIFAWKTARVFHTKIMKTFQKYFTFKWFKYKWNKKNKKTERERDRKKEINWIIFVWKTARVFYMKIMKTFQMIQVQMIQVQGMNGMIWKVFMIFVWKTLAVFRMKITRSFSGKNDFNSAKFKDKIKMKWDLLWGTSNGKCWKEMKELFIFKKLFYFFTWAGWCERLLMLKAETNVPDCFELGINSIFISWAK